MKKLPVRESWIVLLAAVSAAPACAQLGGAWIVVDPHATPIEKLAAREVARYIYLRTGLLPQISSKVPARGLSIFIETKAEARAHRLRGISGRVAKLGDQEFVLHKIGNRLDIVGGAPIGALYGAYRLVEKMGVRFYLDGDTIPDQHVALRLPDVDEVGKPIFNLRGIQPFHDFPEGPDWWNENEYKAVIGQLAKLRMNFIGLHTYPEGGVGAEPLVWIGQPKDVRPDGTVAYSYPAQWASTARIDRWGYAVTPTGEFTNGGSQIFPQDVFGPDAQTGNMPMATTHEGANAVFNASGRMFRNAFRYAHELGIKTCVGTETPLTIPAAVSERLKLEGKDPTSQATIRELYRGIFTRIQRAYPSDYYWLWTPEDWTWGGNSPVQFQRTVSDMTAAEDALKDIGSTMKLATCGWVLGPQNDRAALDRVLPKSVPVSTINREVGYAPVEPGFADVHGRSKWAIPWMENDPSLSAPQMWAGRMKADAADAFRYGCDGLFGIHWRTKVLEPTVAALAESGWDASLTKIGATDRLQKANPSGAIGGSLASFSQPIAGTEDLIVYQTCRYGMSAYDIKAPKGRYRVVLKFCEPFYDKVGERVFSVSLNGKRVIDDLDSLARVGKNRALDFTFDSVDVFSGRLRIAFEPKVGLPMICGIVVTGKGYERKIDCGGPAYKDYVADQANDAWQDRNRALPVRDFYLDFANANFGANVGHRIGAILARIDGVNLPKPADWIDGPGGITINSTPWSEVSRQYAFVDELGAIEKEIQGAGNLSRFQYWLETFRYMRSMGETGCLRGQLDGLVKQLGAAMSEEDRAKFGQEAEDVRQQMSRSWDQMIRHLLQTISTPGELGTVANLEQHVRVKDQFLTSHLKEIGSNALPIIGSLGFRPYVKPRLTVTTLRSLLEPGESLTIPILLQYGASDPVVTVHWRMLGKGDFHAVTAVHLGRGVYRATVPPVTGIGLEYYVTAPDRNGHPLTFPATAPMLNQTAIVMPK
ncbi:MAG: malectin domain-containing carbohydrate-binding protein [Fimbriimonas sp.]|nr:malectin domain-containing carbohydrate-binding protein [Fimbriimonas sp.]